MPGDAWLKRGGGQLCWLVCLVGAADCPVPSAARGGGKRLAVFLRRRACADWKVSGTSMRQLGRCRAVDRCHAPAAALFACLGDIEPGRRARDLAQRPRAYRIGDTVGRHAHSRRRMCRVFGSGVQHQSARRYSPGRCQPDTGHAHRQGCRGCRGARPCRPAVSPAAMTVLWQQALAAV